MKNRLFNTVSRRPVVRGLATVALLAGVAFFTLPGMMMPLSVWWNQSFRLQPALAEDYESASLAGYPVLRARPAAGAEGDRALVYFHGIAGHEKRFIEGMRAHGHAYSPPLPGYYRSEGATTGATMRASARELVGALLDRHDRVVVIGHSLGGHPALAAAAAHPGTDRLLLFSTFDRIGDVCAQWLGPLCARFGDQLDSGRHAARLAVPVTQFHAIDDGVIHLDNGARLFTSIETDADARFVPIPGSHVNFSMDGALEQVFEDIDDSARAASGH